jgi:hydroxymethylbilane synthase
MANTTMRLATRGSPLALIQARLVVAALRDAGVDAEPVVVETSGDRRKDLPIHSIGGQGVFVKEVDAAVLDGIADASVHSAKDLPSSATGQRAGGQRSAGTPSRGAPGEGAAGTPSRGAPGQHAAGEPRPLTGELPIAAVLPRSDPRDALVGERLDSLRAGARIATGSVRRRAQLAWLRPDLSFEELRGNMATRLDKVPAGGAVVVAMAALVRLGLEDRATQVLTRREMLPQVGQGAVAVCCLPDDGLTLSRLAMIDDAASRAAVTAERAWLAATGGGCDLPVGAHADVSRDGGVELAAMIASLDGHILVRGSSSGEDPEAVGAALASSMLSSGGGRALLEPLGIGP